MDWVCDRDDGVMLRGGVRRDGEVGWMDGVRGVMEGVWVRCETDGRMAGKGLEGWMDAAMQPNVESAMQTNRDGRVGRGMDGERGSVSG